jgi:hypothetical protein
MSTRLIALTRHGMGIAQPSTNGQWTVEEYSSPLPFTCLASAGDEKSAGGPETLMAGTQGQGVWISADGGRKWEPLGLAGVIVKSIRVSPSHILVGTKNPPLIYISADHGATWQELTGFRNIPSRPYWFSPAEKPYTAYVMGVDHAPGKPDYLIAGMEAGAVVSRQDGGLTWSDHLAGTMRDCHAIGYHAHDTRYAYAVGGNGQGAAFSRDGGVTWADCREGMARRYAWAFAADPHDPELWFVAAAPGPREAHGDNGNAQAHIYRRYTPGDPEQIGWEHLAGGLPQPLPSMPYSLVAPPDSPGLIYAGLRNGQVYRSHDFGDEWELLPVRFDGIRRTLLVST